MGLLILGKDNENLRVWFNWRKCFLLCTQTRRYVPKNLCPSAHPNLCLILEFSDRTLDSPTLVGEKMARQNPKYHNCHYKAARAEHKTQTQNTQDLLASSCLFALSPTMCLLQGSAATQVLTMSALCHHPSCPD